MDSENTMSLAYKAFIKEKHERLFNTPQEVIDNAVEKATGSYIQTKERIIKGELNEVYNVRTTTGQEIIVRISHNENPVFEFEKKIIDQCRTVGVPVPEVLLVDTLIVADKKLAISIESKIPGIPFGEIENLSEIETKNLIKQAGEILSKINSIKIEGLGTLDSNGRGKYSSMKNLIMETFDEEKMLNVAKSIELEDSLMKKALEVIRDGAEHYPEISPCLIHNDYGPKHLLVHNNKITGVIDFEIARSGDPVREFARWVYFYNETGKDPHIDSFKEGYTDKTIFSDTFEQRFRTWTMYLILAHLNYFIEDKNQIGIDMTKKELEKEISSFYK